VRGATLRTTVDAAAQQAARQAVRPADADAVRDSLEEFEAAVARAHRDTGEHPRPVESRPRTPSPTAEDPTDRRPDRRHDHRSDVSPERTDRTEPSDASHRTEPITDPISVQDTPYDQNHLPEGAEQ
jgi:hypothetical protein